jgi:NAD(P)-dependent dehydrogenase (short-subunit alcohol dehydrogenase family)
MAVNAKSVFLGTKHAIPAMRRAGGGSIVNLASVAGFQGSYGAAAYSASKGAVRLLTKSTALRYGSDNIRCNAVSPAAVQTMMVPERFNAPPNDNPERPSYPGAGGRNQRRSHMRCSIWPPTSPPSSPVRTLSPMGASQLGR